MHERSDRHRVALLVTRNFPPLLGGMEKVNQHLLAALQPVWSTVLCGPVGSSAYAQQPTEVRECRVKPLMRFLLECLWHAVWIARQRRPEWVIAGSGLTAPIAWLTARCCGSHVAVYLHGLDIVAPSRVYQTFWLPFIRRCDLALVNSANTARLAQQHGVGQDRLHVLHPGTDLPTLNGKPGQDFRKSHALGQRPLLLSVGRLTQRKGLAEFVSRSLPAIVARHPDLLLLIIGDEASDALHTRTGSERERILAAARVAGVESNLHFLGRCDESTLAAAYQAAELHIFPVLELAGDVEGFGMVALESAAHGLRTVAFAVGGVADAIEEGHTGSLVESGNYLELSNAVIQELAKVRDGASIASCRAFAASKAWPLFGVRLRHLLGASNV